VKPSSGRVLRANPLCRALEAIPRIGWLLLAGRRARLIVLIAFAA
jgi:hypothetical protein